MPNCFQIFRKGSRDPLKLVVVDEELCSHFGVQPHPKFWFQNWPDIIGYNIATVNDANLGTEKLRCRVREFDDLYLEPLDNGKVVTPSMILEVMEDKYTSDGWYQPK